MTNIKINSAYSAQPSIFKPNPFVLPAIKYIFNNNLLSKNNKIKIADQGCGKLRHLKIFRESFSKIYLIDTEFQLNRQQIIFNEENTIREYINTYIKDKEIYVLSNKEFMMSHLNVDIIFNICGFDVETPNVRKEMVSSAYLNIKNGGFFVIIIPRNIHSVIVRCNKNNKYQDGHIFYHHGIATFYKNYDIVTSLVHNLDKIGFSMVADLSKYEYVCLILNKP